MTKVSIVRFIVFFQIILICFSCGNEIKLFPDEIPSEYMVYGILDANSDSQYVKIRKTFGGNSDLAGMTGNSALFNPPDSLEVRIEEWTETGVNFFPLTKSLLSKEPGLFDEETNIVFQGAFLPTEKTRYDLYIRDPETEKVIKASTEQIAKPIIRFPTTGHTVYRFADTLNAFYVKYVPTGSVHLQQFYINYIEILNSGDTLYKTANFELNPRFKHPLRPVVTYTRTYSKDYVVNLIRMLILKDESVIERQLHSFDFFVWAGDEYLKDYLQLAENYNDNRRQFFSNIDGGMGIFAACAHSKIEGVYPRQYFYDTLATAYRLKDLSFSKQRFEGEFIKKKPRIPDFKPKLSR